MTHKRGQNVMKPNKGFSLIELLIVVTISKHFDHDGNSANGCSHQYRRVLLEMAYQSRAYPAIN
jgi:hypothetical protein